MGIGAAFDGAAVLLGKGSKRALAKVKARNKSIEDQTIENALDAAHVYNNKLTSTAIPVVNRIKEFLPDETSRSKVFHYIHL